MIQPQFPMAQFEDGMIWRVNKANTTAFPVPDSDPPETTSLLGYYLRQVTNYRGQLDGGPEQVAQQIRDVPAVWFCFNSTTYNEATGLWDAIFTGVCIATDVRNEQAARRGAGVGSVGVYQIARDVAALIDGHAFDVAGATAMRCTKIDVPFNMAFEKTRAAIALLTFTVHWNPDDAGGPAGASPSIPREGSQAEGDFDTFDVAWDIPPFSNPEAPIPSEAVTPAPGTYDAEDTITVNPEE